MAFYKLILTEKGLFKSVQDLLVSLVETKVIDLLIFPQISPYQGGMTLVIASASSQIEEANVFIPFLPFNAARAISEATFKNPDKKIGVVLRPCEIRAVVELSKLQQIKLDHIYIIGVDCLGTYESRDFQKLIKKFDNIFELTEHLLSLSREARPNQIEGYQFRDACQGCEYPVAHYLDMGIHFLGLNTQDELLVETRKELTVEEQKNLKLIVTQDISTWQGAKTRCEQERIKKQDEIFKDLEGINGPDDFLHLLEHCRRCHNCQKECPICYCRECIFEGKTFVHEFSDYLRWIGRKGKVRLPADTLLYHLTRMNHMVSSCVACGQCSSACPNDIPVAKLFKFVGKRVQRLFDYVPGRDPEEKIVQATFREDEFLKA